LLVKEHDHDIVVSILHDHIPVGGMTYKITASKKKKTAKSLKTGHRS
jgi:hypothetical protein